MNKILFLAMAIAIAVVMVALPVVAPIIAQPATPTATAVPVAVQAVAVMTTVRPLLFILLLMPTIVVPLGYVHAQSGGPSGCPDPGQCTCNAASGVMTDHAMQAPFNRINNGCTEEGWF